jgi:glycine/D-amino acid oxidase-like deaminating enzyme
MRVVICGGGVIGACTAYFLARRGIDVLIVERTEVAAAASGKAGGLLALDWCTGTPLDALARRSFELHKSLAREIASDWAYQRTTAYSAAVVSDRDHRRNRPAGLAWLSNGVIIAGPLGSSAQIHLRCHECRAKKRRSTPPRTRDRHSSERQRISGDRRRD